MITSALSHREKRSSFSSRKRTLQCSIKTSSASEHPSQKQYLQRLSQLLVRLEDPLRQADALPPNSDDSSSLDTIFNLLFSGWEATIRYADVWFQDSSLSGQTRAAERLEDRVNYHVKVATLITTLLERTCFRHAPNARIELQKTGAKWGERQAQLNEHLKRFFQCPSDVLIYNSDDDPVTSQSPLSPSLQPAFFSLSESGSRLRQIHTEAEELVPGFPQSAPLEKVMRVAIYSLARVPAMRKDSDHGPCEKADAARQWLHIHGCGWVIHCLIKQQMRKAGGRIKQLTELMLEEIIQAYSTYDEQSHCSAISEAQEPYRFHIEDPLEESSKTERYTDLADNWVGYRESVQHAIAFSSEAPPSAKLASPSGFEEDQHGCDLDQAAPSPFEEELSFDRELQTSCVIDNQLPSEIHWISSRVRVFKPERDGRIRILTQQGQSFLESYIDPRSDEIVPSYAFNGRPQALWFRTNSKEADLFFSAPDNRISDLADFQGLFTRSDFDSHFLADKIISLELRNRNSKQTRQFSHPTAQIWTAQSADERRYSDHSVRSAPTNSSESAISPSQVDFAEEVEDSRIHFFCEPSIFTISISGQIHVRAENNDVSVIESDLRKGTSLSVFETEGTARRLIGIPLHRSTLLQETGATKCVKYYSVRIVWQTTEAMDNFIRTFETRQRCWLAKSTEKRARRESLRNPIIEPKSHLTVSTRSRKPQVAKV